MSNFKKNYKGYKTRDPDPTNAEWRAMSDEELKNWKPTYSYRRWEDLSPSKQRSEYAKALRQFKTRDIYITPGTIEYEAEQRTKNHGPGYYKEKFAKTPLKHDLPGGEVHVHDHSFDVDTDEKDFTRRDKSIYVTNKKKKEKKKKEKTVPKKKKDTWYRDSDNDGNVISRAWKNRPKYKVIFNNSPMVPGFVKVVRKN